jgi:hypothetical protein
MAWDSQYALDGFFQFGGPLNVTRYIIDPDDNTFGQSTDTYWVARFLLDEEIYVISRLDALLRGPMVYYPAVYLLRRLSASADSKWVTERMFFKTGFFHSAVTSLTPGIQALQRRDRRSESRSTRLITGTSLSRTVENRTQWPQSRDLFCQSSLGRRRRSPAGHPLTTFCASKADATFCLAMISISSRERSCGVVRLPALSVATRTLTNRTG